MALNAFHLSLGQVITTALGIVLTGAIGRTLGAADFGVWYLLYTIVGLLYVFVDWGYSSYIIREVSRHPERAGELTGTVLAVRAIAVCGLSGPAVLVTSILGYDAHLLRLTMLVCVASIPTYLLTSFSWTFRGRERMDVESTLGVLVKVLMVVATLIWAAATWTLSTLIVVQSIAGIAGFLIALNLYTRLKLSKLRANLATARELLHEAAPIFTMGLMISLQPYIDANMLAKLAGAEVTGWYGAAATLSGTLVAPAVILAGTFYPRLARTTDDAAEFTRLVHTALRPMLFVAVLGAVGTFLFADVAIATVYRRDAFAPAAAVLRAFAPSLLLVSIDMLFGNTILAAGRIGGFARAKLVTVAVTALLEWFLIPLCQARFGNGGLGVMAAFATGELLLIGAALQLMPRGTLDRRSIGDLARALAVGAATLLTIEPLLRLPPALTIPLTVVLFAGGARIVGLVTREDVERIASLVMRRPLVVAPVPAGVAE